MNKNQLIWIAESLNLPTHGTIPALEQRIAIANTKSDAELIADRDPHAAMVMNTIVHMRHQLALRAELKDVDEDTSNDFFIEEKFDGMRAWLIVDGQKKYCYSRHYTKDIRLNAISNINNIDLCYIPETLGFSIFDVELYVNDSSVSRHDRLGLSIASFSTIGQVRKRAKPIILDCVMLNGQDISKRSYAERRELMQKASLQGSMSQQFAVSVHEAFDCIVNEQQGEGLVVKQKDSPYLFGERAAWYKFKTGYSNGRNEYTVLITGMGDRGRGRNAGKVGSITISDLNGQPLGEVGTFDDYTRSQLTDETTGLLKPRLIGRTIEVRAMELTRDNKLRHAAFVRFLN